MKPTVLERLRGGLIVSCQALHDEPLHGAEIMARMALAAKQGGAVGVRANGAQDIHHIKSLVDLPVIGIVKREYAESEVYITPTMLEVEEVIRAGAEILAVDATNRPRPGGRRPAQFLPCIKQRFPDVCLMADVATVEEGIDAERYGADVISTTMSGYTTYSPPRLGPDFALMEELVQNVSIPVIAEGHIRTPEEALQCFQLGVWAVVVGSAITRPQEITRTFVEHLQTLRQHSPERRRSEHG